MNICNEIIYLDLLQSNPEVDKEAPLLPEVKQRGQELKLRNGCVLFMMLFSLHYTFSWATC